MTSRLPITSSVRRFEALRKATKRGQGWTTEGLSSTALSPRSDLFDRDVPEAAEFRRLYLRLRGSNNPSLNQSPVTNHQSPITNHHRSGPYRSFLITSAAHEEGKTTIASYLALTFAKFDSGTTLLIDGDTRKPKIHQLFGLKRGPGLLDLLSEASDYEGCIKDSGLDNLKILTSGDPHVRSSEAIEKKKISRLLSGLGRSFDTIIIDVPPVLPVVDPLIWGPEVDATLMVVMVGETPRKAVQHARELLVNAKANLIGVVTNNVKNTLPYYYDYRYYKYYKYYGEKSRKR